MSKLESSLGSAAVFIAVIAAGVPLYRAVVAYRPPLHIILARAIPYAAARTLGVLLLRAWGTSEQHGKDSDRALRTLIAAWGLSLVATVTAIEIRLDQ